MRRYILIVAGFAFLGVSSSVYGQNVDYPRKALKEGKEGTTTFTVRISDTGQPSNCVIVQSSGSPDLDEATCKTIVKRGRFAPAKNENGQPIESEFSSAMIWKIPR